MNEYMKDAIATHAWHEFLYGEAGEERKKFLDSMADDYPIKLDSNEPAVIYVDDFSLPKVDAVNPLDTRVSSIAREYCSFSLVAALVEQTIRQNELSMLNEKLSRFIKSANRMFITDEDMSISDIEGLRNALLAGKKFYLENYTKLMETGNWYGDFSTLPISFIDLSTFVTSYKRALGRSAHFAFVLDYSGTGAIVSQKAVNGLVTKRIAGDAAIKVVCHPEEWKSYTDLNGILAEDVHDYSSVDLDGSFREYVNALRKKNGLF